LDVAGKGDPRTGGRKKGVPNKVTADIKAAFRKHGPELVKALISLTKSKDENVRVKAINSALDRGYGKPAQTIEANIQGEITVRWDN
jgi:lambda repressor-like predicted transcriptional regulator